MPNWCSNEMAIVGPSSDLEAIQKLINDLFKDESKHGSLLETALALGYPEEEARDFDCRGFYNGEVQICETKDGRAYLDVFYDSAWTPCIDFWNKILKDHFPDCVQYTLAEECGCDVYYNTDESRTFLPYDYLVSYSNPKGDGGTEYFRTMSDALEWLSEQFGRKLDSEEDLEKMNDEFSENDVDGYAYVKYLEPRWE